MKSKHLSWESREFDQQETFFRLINPDEYARFGIDPQDVPMGTFAAEDHPSFLPSRFGGNAYGLGLIEQSVLSKADTDFLESIDFQDAVELSRHTKRLNAVYQKLGLLIRFSLIGKRYFLIPISLVAHSLQDIKHKADEIEEMVLHHILETRRERLDIGILTSSHDLIVHELTARLSSHRIFLFETVDKLRSWRLPLDLIVIPKDIFEFLLEQQLPRASKRPLSRRRLTSYAVYLTGKIYDVMEPTGKLLVLAHSAAPKEDQTCQVRFKTDEELKSFLLFAHIYRTKKRYQAASARGWTTVHIADLHYYLNRFAVSEPHLKRLLNHQKPKELKVDEVNRLGYLNLRIPQAYVKNPEKQWKGILEPYFDTLDLKSKSPKHQHRYWQERLEIDCEMPESLLVFVGRPRQPTVTLEDLEADPKATGMRGCTLPLVAEYRNSFRYVLDVLRILIQIRDHSFSRLSELERSRLSNPFRARSESFSAVLKLVSQIKKIERTREVLNPDHIEGQVTPILENIPKLSLHGFTPAQLREILLIVVGHTTFSRIVFGKLPAKTLKPITDKAREGDYQEILSLLRVCRLMSMAEIVAALGDNFTGEQARELYRLYDDAIYVATNPKLDWDKLNDLRISALGGVQNKAIREMMKFFNLFEFLDNWQESIHKGAFQQEVICDYQPEKLHHLEEALELARIATQFKQQFLGDYLFGQSYFFRQFLNTEFHGTGHLFPKLGTRAGFMLLWITVISSQRHIVNYNPMLAGIPLDRQDQRIAKIKEALLRIPIEQLPPDFFEDIKKTLADGRPAFIFDTGVRLMSNPETRAIDISFVDVEENIQQIEFLLNHFESQKLRGISLKNLQDMERLFSELESFQNYLSQTGCYLQCDVFDGSGGLEVKDREIAKIELRLKQVLQSQIFIPEEIYDNISVLAKHCPEMLRFVLPEFHAFGNLVENWPTRQKQSLGIYVMRCLEKFQALIIKDRDAFQDNNTFYQQAKQEFGPLAEEGIGASHAQMEILEYLVDRVQQRPQIYQALTFALLFQEIGKIEKYVGSLPRGGAYLTHAEAGALVLENSPILGQHDLDAQVERLVVLLVRYHGLIGHVLQGEEPITVLDHLIVEEDDRLLDVFVLHAILAAASVQEGLLVSDMLDAFLSYRAAMLQVIKSKSNWRTWLIEAFCEKGKAVLADFQMKSGDKEVFPFPSEKMHYCGFVDAGIEDEALWRGRQISALERLLKMMGVNWVDYHDLQMHLLKVPINFIYHKKKLKSVGLETFEQQIRTAVRLLGILSTLNPDVRYYFLYCLDHLGAAVRIYDFHPLAKFLEPAECLKLLMTALQAFHHHFGTAARNGLISFRPLSQKIERRHKALQNMLEAIPFPEGCLDGQEPCFSSESYGGLHFRASSKDNILQIEYQDTIQFENMLRSLASQWTHDELIRRYKRLIRDLRQKLPYDTRDFEEELKKVFEQQQREINDRTLKEYQERLSTVVSFVELQRIQDEINEKRLVMHFQEEQRFQLKEMFEFHRSRLREDYLDSIYQEINAFESRSALAHYWGQLKYELFAYRSYVGKEYESLIAEFIDQKYGEIKEP